MVTNIGIERKARYVRRLLASIEEFYAVHGRGIEMNALAAKYNRALDPHGGFPEVVEELRLEGSIDVVFKPTGGKTVWPAGQCLKLPKGHVLLVKN